MPRRTGTIPLSPTSPTCALALDKSDDTLYLLDNTGIRRVSADGVTTNLKIKAERRLGEVEAAVADGQGNLYVTQRGNHALWKVTIVRNDAVLYRIAGAER